MRRGALGAAAFSAFVAVACQGRLFANSHRDAEAAGLVLSTPPASLPLKLAIDFEGQVELIGAKLTPPEGLKPGSRVQLTLYWRRLAKVEPGFRLFTHVLDGAGERILNLDDVGPLRKLEAGGPKLPPSAWEIDKVYVDEQTFTVPATLRTDTLRIVAGLFREEQRLAVRSGPRLGTRGLVASVSVARASARPSAVVPELWVPRVPKGAEVLIDGKLDEVAWSRAGATGELVNVRTGEPELSAELSGNVRLLYDNEWLYVGFDVFDSDLQGGFDPAQVDPQLWTKDTVELMVDPDGDGDNLDYYEIQVGPQNLVFDSQFDSYNQPKVEPNGPFGHQEWSSGLRSAVVLNGTLDAPGEDDGYVVEMAIPWTSFGKAKRLPPTRASVWRMNFYVMQNNSGLAWSPILGQGNFHKTSRFGRVRFAK